MLKEAYKNVSRPVCCQSRSLSNDVSVGGEESFHLGGITTVGGACVANPCVLTIVDVDHPLLHLSMKRAEGVMARALFWLPLKVADLILH